MLEKYNSFVGRVLEKDSDIDLPKEVINSTLIIVRGMYEQVKHPEFIKEEDDYFIKFGVTEADFGYIDPNENLPLDLSVKAMDRRKYYVELIYDDQYPGAKEVSYTILFEPMTEDKYRSKHKQQEDEFMDEFEIERKRDLEDFDDDIDDTDFE